MDERLLDEIDWEKVIIRTSCYGRAANAAGAISISRGTPSWATNVKPTYWPLAPGPWFRSVSEEEYRKRYGEQLAALDPRKVVFELYEATEGVHPILLCWEHLIKPGEWCHRTIVGEWLERETGIVVREI